MPEEDDTQTIHGDKVEIPADEAYRLQRIAVLRNLEGELEDWAKKRFRTALIAISVGGFIGIQAIGYVVIDQILGDKIDAATVEAELLKAETARVKNESDQAIKRSNDAFALAVQQGDEVTIKLTKLTEEAEKLNERFVEVSGKFEAASENVRSEARLAVDGLEKRLANLTQAVAELKNQNTNVAAVLTRQAALDTEITNRKLRFVENSDYTIEVRADKEGLKTEKIVSYLRNLGFRVRVYYDSKGPRVSDLYDYLNIQPNATVVFYEKPDREKAGEIANELKGEFGETVAEAKAAPPELLKFGVEIRPAYLFVSIGV